MRSRRTAGASSELGRADIRNAGTPLFAGRDFEFADADRRAWPFHQAMARYYFGTASPLGGRLTFERDTVTMRSSGSSAMRNRKPARRGAAHGLPPRVPGRRVRTRFALRMSATRPQWRRRFAAPSRTC